MVLNRVYRYFALLFVIGLLATYFCSTVYCESTSASQASVNFTLARGSVREVEAEIKEKVDTVTEMVKIKNALESAIGQIEKSSRMNALQSVAGGFAKSPVPIVMALANQISNTTTALDIVPKHEKLILQISDLIATEIDRDIYQRTPDGYNAVWDRYIEAYGELEGQDLQFVNKYVLGYDDQKDRTDQLQKKKKALPDPELLSVKECNGVCGGFFHDADTHLTTDPCKGCGESWYTCDKKAQDRHRVRYCAKGVYFNKWDPTTVGWPHYNPYTAIYLGTCGQAYRKCDDSRPKLAHWYQSIVEKNPYTGKKYLKGWRVSGQKSSCGSINSTTPPAVSINGPNGVGVSDSAVGDASPGCSSCLDGSKHCPDASSNHPKTVPDAVSDFRVYRGSARGSIVVSWDKPDFDGYSKIKDYEYKMDWKSNGSYVSWNDWTSVGKGWSHRYYKVITGLHSNARYRVTIRARNDKGTSTSWHYKYINVK